MLSVVPLILWEMGAVGEREAFETRVLSYGVSLCITSQQQSNSVGRLLHGVAHWV